ncbi:FxsC protein [Streptomyces europaeiscabiei]|uniref:FxsC protein n=1 Tax=Streptomyces europaeiscabiei TaxID=146819 RepID=A0ABU4N6R8_9ACTN|nr:FxsC protein [Streptomyces europaeiscabiei]MDX2523485.1 FxsC protein [Streptomyces europaeiscabiei]MDX2758559.1 FxsC protein [Streptomyces europaeiscabiei]MDX2768499.1 FxsC protein [Streptomyces europaeiscabiei]MDX3541798.1 FxsC protein [Streptomyces europaeiscabiei]MDX3550791.1 FxsC protein [Streptomyces europaeiscabiei]
MPMFYMSYARVPAPRHRDISLDPNRLVFQFFDELCGKVAQHARVSREEAGFVERPGAPGEKSIKALLGCQVFVPLYSKRYFSNPQCGRQWTAVTQGSTQGGPPSIVPVLWTPCPPTSLPKKVKEQYPEVPDGIGEAGDNYASMGLHRLLDQLLDLTEGPDPEGEGAADKVAAQAQVAQVTDWLAQRIVDQAATVPRRSRSFPSGGRAAEPTTLAGLDDAFADPPFASPLHITVLAPTEEQLPVGRDNTRYGPRVDDWRPYGQAVGPLVEQMEALARNLGFEPTVHPFHKHQAELRSAEIPTAPWILVVDPWALENTQMASQAREFDRARQPWTAVLSTLAGDDLQTKEQSDRLRGLLLTHFPRFLSEGRAGEQDAVRGLAGADVFTRWFSELAEATKIRYLRYIHSQLSRSGAEARDVPESGADLPRRPDAGRDNGAPSDGRRVEGRS